VTPETGHFLAKAHRLIAEADAMLKIDLNDAAGRTAYLAGFHAAQALISEATGRTIKTHKGVHREFHRLTKDDPRLDTQLRAFLSKTYNLKAIADYETGPSAEISAERATMAVEQARRFVVHVDNQLNPV
jgi:uncharacterized protein (UPF0332 family)